MTTVTVVIPTRDRLAYLGESISSVVNQTEQDLRIVVIDNGTTAGAEAVVEQYGAGRTELIRGNGNLGVIGNLNVALQHGVSEFVMVFHDDDVMHPRLIERELEIFARHKRLAWVGSAYREVTDHAQMTTERELPAHYRLMPDARTFVLDVISAGAIGFPSVLYRRELLGGLNLLDERFGTMADRPLLAQLAGVSGAARLQAPYVSYRIHPKQVTQAGDQTQAQVLAMLRYYRSTLSSSWTRRERAVFLRYSTNSLLDMYQALPVERRTSLVTLLRSAYRDGLLDPLAVRRAGVAAIARVVLRAMRTLGSVGE